MWGGSVATKRDFFRMIGDIRTRSMTQPIIKSAFRSRGIWSINSKLIIDPIIDQYNAQAELTGF